MEGISVIPPPLGEVLKAILVEQRQALEPFLTYAPLGQLHQLAPHFANNNHRHDDKVGVGPPPPLLPSRQIHWQVIYYVAKHLGILATFFLYC